MICSLESANPASSSSRAQLLPIIGTSTCTDNPSLARLLANAASFSQAGGAAVAPRQAPLRAAVSDIIGDVLAMLEDDRITAVDEDPTIVSAASSPRRLAVGGSEAETATEEGNQ